MRSRLTIGHNGFDQQFAYQRIECSLVPLRVGTSGIQYLVVKGQSYVLHILSLIVHRDCVHLSPYITLIALEPLLPKEGLL